MASGIPSQAHSSAASEIRIANNMDEIARVAELVDSFGADNRLSGEVVIALNVSLDEILNNIISYAYADADRHDILVRLELRSGKVDVVVEDDGRPFDPLLAPAPDLTAKDRLGGVGLHFVRNLMDELEYARCDGINRLRMMKKLNLKQSSDKAEPSMKLVEETNDDVTIVEAYGRLDSTTAKEFGERLMSLVRAGRSSIVVDLKNIVYISSAGFRALLIANRATAEKQGKLALCGVIGEVKRLFDIGAFTNEFLICQTQADGIGKLRQ